MWVLICCIRIVFGFVFWVEVVCFVVFIWWMKRVISMIVLRVSMFVVRIRFNWLFKFILFFLV